MAQRDSIFDSARAAVSRSFIESRFHSPGARWVGNNFQTLNPLRPDGTIGSFSIREDGTWYDFALPHGQQTGDVFDLLEAIEGRPAIEIAREMAGGSVAAASESRAAQASSNTRESLKPDWKPIPDGAMPTFRSPPSNVTIYHDKNGDACFIVARHEGVGNAKKKIMPIYYDGVRFVPGIPPSIDYRPLYAFDSHRTVIVVEGEKKRAELEEFLGERYSVTCWHGGAGAAEKVYVGDLKGCDVILWPDADDVGLAAMDHIARSALRAGAQRVRIVAVPPNVPKGWDCADAIRENRGIDVFLQTAEEFKLEEDESVDEEELALGDLDFPYSDLGNAERFVAIYGKVLRYNIEKNAWLVWDGRRWDDGDQSKVTPMIKRTIRTIAVDGDIMSVAFAKKSESRSAINAMLSLASLEPGIPVHEHDLDPDPYIFNAKNGMVNLLTGELTPHDPRKLCSKIASIDYNPEATCPQFEKFLSEIMLGRADFVEFLQRWFGYSMTADMSAQVFVIFFGAGANGKSTLVELIAKIMGAYGKAAPPETFIQKTTTGGIPNDVAALRGSRFVLTTETEANAKLAESRIKSMTGGDTVSARFMRGEFFEFRPTWKIVISTNHRPKISGADYGIWRRIILIPFDFLATPDKADPMLAEKLWSEAEGILAWMIRGAVKWAQDGRGRAGLKVSDAISMETQCYREDEDIIGRFVAEACWKRGEGPFDVTKMKCPAGELLAAFQRWAIKEGEHYSAKISATSFGRAMRERGYEKVRTAIGNAYLGISPKTEEAMAQEAKHGVDDGR